jgi:predicted nucleic acid-binding protein
LLQPLPQAPVATNAEVLVFIARRRLMGRGIGYIDGHLLAATALAGTAQAWTRDKRLRHLAAALHMAYESP